jgi:tripartite-type tricarboxylate transporter receptor subunit TctC
MRRREFLVLVGLIAAPTQALAQSWPQQAIHFIISFGAGGGADIVGRILAEAMQNRLGQPVVVENKPGAGGILGNELVASATDGRGRSSKALCDPPHRPTGGNAPRDFLAFLKPQRSRSSPARLRSNATIDS